MQKQKEKSWHVLCVVLILFLCAGLAAGAASCLAMRQEDLYRMDFLRIHIVSRAGGIGGADVFWRTMKKSLHMAAFWASACVLDALWILGCAALVLDAYCFGYTCCALLCLGNGGAMLLSFCIFLPQTLLLWCVYLFMGLLTAHYLKKRKMKTVSLEQSRSKYTILMFACVAVCIPIGLLHSVFTLKLMKLLPVTV